MITKILVPPHFFDIIWAICRIFHKIDQNGNSYISISELRAFILGMEIEELGLHRADFVARVMEQFDTSQDHQINEQEFVTGLSNWLIVARDSVPRADRHFFNGNSSVREFSKNFSNIFYQNRFIFLFFFK